jgi:hypothetical protein
MDEQATYSRTQGMTPRASWCDHDYPMLVTPTEIGSYYARCIACLSVGPERSSSEAARQALQTPLGP